MPCLGNAEDHCCKIKGEDCKYLIRDYTDENGHFRKWACGLRAELGDWDQVLADPRWIEDCKDAWAPGVNCRDWPEEPAQWRGCAICGACE